MALKHRSLSLVLAMACVLPTVARAQDKDEDKPVIAVFNLSGTILEKPAGEEFPFELSGSGTPLRVILERLRKAKDDDNVKAVVLMSGGLSMGNAQMQELRQVMDEFRASGKNIHAHTEMMSTGRLALFSGATEISMVPTGNLFITGLYGEQMFLRGLLDKLGIVPDFFTCGDYKSAGEMFMRSSPSEEAAEMYKWLYDGIYGNTVEMIAKGRGVSVEKAQGWIDQGVYTSETAVKAGVIDKVLHRKELEAELKKTYGKDIVFDRRYGRKKSPTIDLSSPFGVLQFYGELLQPPKKDTSTKPIVAIVYLEGSILPGSGGSSPFGSAMAFSTDIAKALDEVADNDRVKAVVFRVNSPGGSAVASEVILDATKRVKAKKPFVVSMGDVAGSGGYYVACASDVIFADPSTVTGSIGVVSGKFATTGMWNKMGINWSPIARGKNSGLLSSAKVFSPSEKAAMQGYMDDVYEVFKGHVLAIRKDRLKKDIDELAGGRVYTGTQALELGLIDKLGGLDDSIKHIAGEASLKDYDVRVFPRSKNFLEVLLADISGDTGDPSKLTLRSSASTDPLLQAALPYLKGLDPQRTRLAIQAIQQLQILGEENIILTMPLINFSE